MKKRVLAALLIICMLAVMVPTSFAASSASTIEERLQQISSTSPYQNASYQVCTKATDSAFASKAVAVRVTAAAVDVDWQSVYRELVLEQVSNDGNPDSPSTYCLQDLNGDGIPELLIVGPFEAQGDVLYTVRSDGSTSHLAISQGDFMYDAANQLIWAPYGHMDMYRDEIYRLTNGSFVRLHEGRSGLWNASSPSAGYEDYTYEWDGEMVSEQQYQALLDAAVDTEDAVNLSYSAVSAQTVLAQLGAGEDTASGFADVPSSAWFAEAVAYVQSNGLMQGTSDRLFSPNNTTTRAMVVTILYRLEGSPDLSNENLGYPFADVDATSWYGDAVYWARLNGITNGISNTNFGPDGSISREQMAALLYRYADFAGYDVSTGGMSLSEYADASEISSYAVTAMRWAINKGLITGVSNTELDPQGTATRAQVATILMRFGELYQ